MKWYLKPGFKIFNGWKNNLFKHYGYYTVHWFSFTIVFCSDILEIHLWLFNFNFRLVFGGYKDE